jgi:hypothetical protein
LEQLSQDLDSHATETERRLAESEKQKDAIGVEMMERRNVFTKLEKAYETEVNVKWKMENTLRRYYLLSPDEHFSPDVLERVILVLISQNTQLKVKGGTPLEIIGREGKGPRSLSREIETRGSPPGTREPNIKTPNTVDMQQGSDRQPLEEESLSMSETWPANTPIASFCKIGGFDKFDGDDGGSDSGLSDVPATPPSENGHGKALQKSNTSKTKQKSPKVASKPAATAQNSKFSQIINNSSSPIVSKPTARAYSAKRQRSEDSSALKVHGKKRTKFNDLGLKIPDSQIPNLQRTPSQRRQSGKTNSLFLLGM